METANLVNYRMVRSSTPEELQALARLHEETPRYWEAGYEPSHEQIQRCKKRLEWAAKSEDGFLLVAESGDSAIVGFHWIELDEEDSVRFANIKSLWVAETHRRSGIGSRMKRDGESWARGNGARFARTTVHVNNSLMIEWNCRSGYLLHGEIACEFFEMRKPLSSQENSEERCE